MELMLAFAERQIAQVFAIAGEQIECIESRFPTAEHQVSELRIALFVQANNLAIQHATFGAALYRESDIQSREGFELVPIARHQPATAILDIR